MYCHVCKEDRERYGMFETRSGKVIVSCDRHVAKRIGEDSILFRTGLPFFGKLQWVPKLIVAPAGSPMAMYEDEIEDDD